ncbi:longevity assurance factor, putative [Entamoeba invadens IP1]|uniref:Longevity assurance factor, putative n=1 Tax=Entamoeba invadens IP1 TaxID=370355 RepID=A0A0A1UDA8_ENTIV|nr:longevity assurance factor, putative [Entamoeba invadens IP1]ELP94408.1 longevity assurance factor, putative [Entamoeba invadens IP1]|eukprot:XP_004261179.1 longevity assurance factor, putative [Entamoeba invadens IP1]
MRTTKVRPPQTVKDKMSFAQTVALILMVSICFPASMTRYQTTSIPLSENFPKAFDLLPSLCVLLLLSGLRYYFSKRFFQPMGEWCISKKKYGDKIRRERVERFSHCVFKNLYFFVTAPLGVLLFKNEDWVPRVLFGVGKGDISRVWDNFPATQQTKYLALFYNWELGYHLHSLFFHLFSNPRNDFFETLLHHLCSVFLMTFSYTNNCGRIGVLVLLLHDIVDVFMYFSKWAIDLQNVKPGALCFVFLTYAYAKLRLFVFPVYIIPAGAVAINFVPDTVALKYPTYILFMAMLLSLLGLHIYWYYLIMKMLVNLLKGNGARDIHSIVE